MPVPVNSPHWPVYFIYLKNGWNMVHDLYIYHKRKVKTCSLHYKNRSIMTWHVLGSVDLLRGFLRWTEAQTRKKLSIHLGQTAEVIGLRDVDGLLWRGGRYTNWYIYLYIYIKYMYIKIIIYQKIKIYIYMYIYIIYILNIYYILYILLIGLDLWAFCWVQAALGQWDIIETA